MSLGEETTPISPMRKAQTEKPADVFSGPMMESCLLCPHMGLQLSCPGGWGGRPKSSLNLSWVRIKRKEDILSPCAWSAALTARQRPLPWDSYIPEPTLECLLWLGAHAYPESLTCPLQDHEPSISWPNNLHLLWTFPYLSCRQSQQAHPWAQAVEQGWMQRELSHAGRSAHTRVREAPCRAGQGKVGSEEGLVCTGLLLPTGLCSAHKSGNSQFSVCRGRDSTIISK